MKFGWPPWKTRVFISYSRQDKDIVQPIAELLRFARGWVFLDSTSIPLGENWQAALWKGLRRAEIVLVFWCHHSADSEWVQKEIEFAIKQKKSVLPIFLDQTSPSEPLQDYQGLDFKHASRHAWGRPTESTRHQRLIHFPDHPAVSRQLEDRHSFDMQMVTDSRNTWLKRMWWGALALVLGIILLILLVAIPIDSLFNASKTPPVPISYAIEFVAVCLTFAGVATLILGKFLSNQLVHAASRFEREFQGPVQVSGDGGSPYPRLDQLDAALKLVSQGRLNRTKR